MMAASSAARTHTREGKSPLEMRTEGAEQCRAGPGGRTGAVAAGAAVDEGRLHGSPRPRRVDLSVSLALPPPATPGPVKGRRKEKLPEEGEGSTRRQRRAAPRRGLFACLPPCLAPLWPGRVEVDTV